jgi:hypothetical protein
LERIEIVDGFFNNTTTIFAFSLLMLGSYTAEACLTFKAKYLCKYVFHFALSLSLFLHIEENIHTYIYIYTLYIFIHIHIHEYIYICIARQRERERGREIERERYTFRENHENHSSGFPEGIHK